MIETLNSRMEMSTSSKDENDPHSSGDGDADKPLENQQENGSKDKIPEDEGDEANKEDNLNDSLKEKLEMDRGIDLHKQNEVVDLSDSKVEDERVDGIENKTNKMEDETEVNKIDEVDLSVTVVEEQNGTEILKPEENGTSPRDNMTIPSNPRAAEGIRETDNEHPNQTHGLSQQQTKSTSPQPIIIDLISQAMNTPHARDSHAGGDRWTENGRQGVQGVHGGGKSVDFSVPVGMDDDVDAELARVVGTTNDDQLAFDPHEYGRGATTNTPVTVMTDYAESQIQGRGLHTPSREHIYQHALSIMKKRCRSSRTVASNTHTSFYRPKTPENVVEENGAAFPNFSLPAVVANMDKPPLVQNPNCIFYVTQSRQNPIAPVKAWKGYEGNLYFQPVVCKKADLTPSCTPRENALNKATRRAFSTPLAKNKPAESQPAQLPQLPQSQAAGGDARSNTAPSIVGVRSVRSQRTAAPSRQKSFSHTASMAKSRASTARQLAVLDKQSVFSRMDSNIQQDIQWISGLEAMGTLHLGGLKLPRSTAHFYENTGKHHKLKIQRGLVSHQLATNDQSLPTLLGVHGGRLNDSADSVAKTKHLQSQYHACKAPSSGEDRPVYSPNLFDGYSGPFTSIEQLRRDSSSSPHKGNSSPSSDLILKDDSLHSLASVFKNSGNAVPLYSNKEVLFRNREALFLTRPNYR